MAGDTTHVKGLAQLNDFLQQLPVKVERNVLRGSLRAGMSVVKPVAQRNIHSVSGELARGLKVGTKSRGGTVTANLKATGKHRSIAHLLEFGTRAHVIAAKGRGWLSFLGVFSKKVMHPGIAPYGDKSAIGPHSFMRPALDGQATAAVVAAAEYMKRRLESKHGIDTSHVMIDGDE